MPPRKKHKYTAQERVKRSQEAKRRQRQHGGQHSGSFAAGAHTAGHAPIKGAGQPSMTASDRKIHYHTNLAKAHAGDFSPEDIAWHTTRSQRAKNLPGQDPILRREDTDTAPVRVTSADIQSTAKSRAEASWKREPNVYTQRDAVQKGRHIPASTFIEKHLAPGHKKWLKDQLKDPDSEFSRGLRRDSAGNVVNKTKGEYSPGQRNRVSLYTNALQEGATHEEALSKLRGERRGRPSTSRPAAPKRGTRLERAGETPDSIGVAPRQSGRKSRYESVAPSHNEFRIGVASGTADSMSELRSKFPDYSERELVRIDQFQRMYLADELDKNNRWAHETKRANIMGGNGKETDPNRVVFFTTNLGYPAPSVPADSLVGQYVIRRRKAFLRKENSASEKDLHGKFPSAVRDQHIIEASTGLSFGAEGRWGAFQKSGWRRGAKKSRNFGKPVPVGSQVLYDSQGRPLYDAQGNIRFSEGGTRPFKFEALKDVGLRVFVG